MTLAPSTQETLERARVDLRMGLPVVIGDAEGSALVAAAETLSAVRLAEMRGLGDLVLAITARRAETLKARAYDGDLARIVVPQDADIAWLENMADPADDLAMPLKGPHLSLRNGRAELQRAAIRLTKAARLLPAVVSADIADGLVMAATHGLIYLDLSEANAALGSPDPMLPVISARVPLRVSEAGRLHVFRPTHGGEEHYAVEIGQPPRNAPVLTRLHSACFTGDLLGSLKCDCGAQLNAALQKMAQEGAGVLLYLNQEGRGIGLANKMRAYSLQDQGFDTVEANHRLGFEDDERDFRIGADILRRLGFARARLLTNNPAKVEMLGAMGIEVTERVPLKVGLNPLNAKYLDTKAKKSGHIL